MMESASTTASEGRHSMHALKSAVNKKPRWQGSLLLRLWGMPAAREVQSVL